MSMNSVMNNLNAHGVNTDGLDNIIITDALVAAGASAVGAVIPVLAIPSLVVACVGSVWHMYIKLAQRLGVTWGNGVLKAFATAAVTNLSMNLAGILAGELLGSLIPGMSVLVDAALAYYTLYVSGLMFLTMLGRLVNKYGTISNIPDEVDADAIKCDKYFFKDAVKDAKISFKANKSNL